jgi:hypothetical protein
MSFNVTDTIFFFFRTAMTLPPKSSPPETYPDSWARFERAVDAAVKSGPKGRGPEKKKRAKKRPSSRAKKP